MGTRIIHIPVDLNEDLSIIDVPESKMSDSLNQLVEGSFQVVQLKDDVHLWLNEEGKNRGMPLNPRAQILWDQAFGPLTDILVGPAVLTGGYDGAGDTLGLSDQQIDQVAAALGASGSLVRVRIENAYEDGHESVAEFLLTPPADVDDEDSIEEWWEDEVFKNTGDSHGIGNPKLGSCSEVTVISGPTQLVGQTYEW